MIYNRYGQTTRKRLTGHQLCLRSDKYEIWSLRHKEYEVWFNTAPTPEALGWTRKREAKKKKK